MMSLLPIAGLVLLLASSVRGDRFSLDGGVLIHMHEWKWKDIAKECEDFLSPYKFSAVLISPPTENVILPGRPWWERYQPVSYNLVTRSGTEEELQDMVRRCNNVNVRVIAEIVLNQMAAPKGNCEGTGGSTCIVHEFRYPVVGFYFENFHHFGPIQDYQDRTQVRNNELEGVHDLDQSQIGVQTTQVKLLNKLVDMGVAGFRIHAARYMEPSDLEAIFNELHNLNTQYNFPQNLKPFICLEVTGDAADAIQYHEYTHLGKVTDFRYGKKLGLQFQKTFGLGELVNFGTPPIWDVLPKDDSVVFVDNYETQHSPWFPNYIDNKTSGLYKMAVAFMLAYGWGLPILMSSYRFKDKDQGPPADEQGNIQSPKIEGMLCDRGQEKGWVCEQRWRQIYNMVEFHNVARGSEVLEWWTNSQNAIGLCRAGKGYFAMSLESFAVESSVKTCMPEGTYCDVINGELKDDGTCSGTEVSVNSDGIANIKIPLKIVDQVDPILAFHIESKKGYIRKKREPVVQIQSNPSPEPVAPQQTAPQQTAPLPEHKLPPPIKDIVLPSKQEAATPTQQEVIEKGIHENAGDLMSSGEKTGIFQTICNFFKQMFLSTT